MRRSSAHFGIRLRPIGRTDARARRPRARSPARRRSLVPAVRADFGIVSDQEHAVSGNRQADRPGAPHPKRSGHRGRPQAGRRGPRPPATSNSHSREALVVLGVARLPRQLAPSRSPPEAATRKTPSSVSTRSPCSHGTPGNRSARELDSADRRDDLEPSGGERPCVRSPDRRRRDRSRGRRTSLPAPGSIAPTVIADVGDGVPAADDARPSVASRSTAWSSLMQYRSAPAPPTTSRSASARAPASSDKPAAPSAATRPSCASAASSCGASPREADRDHLRSIEPGRARDALALSRRRPDEHVAAAEVDLLAGEPERAASRSSWPSRWRNTQIAKRSGRPKRTRELVDEHAVAVLVSLERGPHALPRATG